MNFEDEIEPLGKRKPATPSPAVDDAAHPEDLLFAVPEQVDEPIRNPYGDDDDGFDDLAIGDGGGLGPYAFDDEQLGRGGEPGLQNLFAADASSFDPADDAPAEVGGPGDGAMPGLMRGYGELNAPAEDSEDFSLDNFGVPAPVPEPPPSVAAPIHSDRAALSADLGPGLVGSASPAEPPRIPGRNRVSYSQGSTKKQYRPTVDGLRSPAAAGGGSLLWFFPFTAFLSGACFSSYYFLRVGSPVLAGVSFFAGALAAMFCRVLFRR